MADKLYDELVEEVLVRLPLEDPRSLLRAALVCKKWGRVVCGPGFRSQFRKFHQRGPPLLGFIATADVVGREDSDDEDGDVYDEDEEDGDDEDGDEEDGDVYDEDEEDGDDEDGDEDDGDFHDEDEEEINAICRFFSTSSFGHVPRALLLHWYAVDSNHGRVLFYLASVRSALFDNLLWVWCPITGSRLQLPWGPRYPNPDNWSAALLCAADAEAGGGGGGACDHLVGCHRRPFLVVLVGTDKDGTFSCVYSSADGAWGEPTSAQIPPCRGRLKAVPAARVGNALHFLLEGSASILRYDVAARGFSVIERPPQCPVNFQGCAVLMSMDDGKLGFAAARGHALRVWAREVGADGLAAWVQRTVIMLNTHGNGLPRLIGYGAGVFFVWTARVGLSLVNVRSNQVSNEETHGDLYGLVPYITYCIPALRGGIFGIIEGDGPNAGS